MLNLPVGTEYGKSIPFGAKSALEELDCNRLFVPTSAVESPKMKIVTGSSALAMCPRQNRNHQKQKKNAQICFAITTKITRAS